MYKEKYLFSLLVICIAFSLTACGKNNLETQGNNTIIEKNPNNSNLATLNAKLGANLFRAVSGHKKPFFAFRLRPKIGLSQGLRRTPAKRMRGQAGRRPPFRQNKTRRRSADG